MALDQIDILSHERIVAVGNRLAGAETEDAKHLLDSIAEEPDEPRIENPIIPTIMRGLIGVFYASAFILIVGLFWAVCKHIAR